ncbi:MAG: hypothetical protein AAGJ10_18020 [Bacteroidota bacterium]
MASYSRGLVVVFGILVALSVMMGRPAQAQYPPAALEPYIEVQQAQWDAYKQPFRRGDRRPGETAGSMVVELVGAIVHEWRAAQSDSLRHEAYLRVHQKAIDLLIQKEGRPDEYAARERIGTIMVSTFLGGPASMEDMLYYTEHMIGGMSLEFPVLVWALETLGAEGHEVTTLSRKAWANMVVAKRSDQQDGAEALRLFGIDSRVAQDDTWLREVHPAGQSIIHSSPSLMDEVDLGLRLAQLARFAPGQE